MNILEYLIPENHIARLVVDVLLGVFIFWFGLLTWNILRNLHCRRQLRRCEDVSLLLGHEPPAPQEASSTAPTLSREGGRVFEAFRRAKGLKENGLIARHLRAIFAAGWNESHLDVRGLIKNTTDALFFSNSLHRSLLSIFIILGLLGTLFGLADTLASLDTALRGSNGQISNDALNQGLQRLLGSLRGAFAPSILGVSLTVAGVVVYAVYLRFVAAPLGSLLEHLTLTEWAPRLVPTTSQKLQQKMQLSREQMERSVAAAREVTEFADEFQDKTGSLNETMGYATDTLRQMAVISERLGKFSQEFAAGLKPLTPFQQQLQALYQQMLNESRAFQESVAKNIAGSKEFQEHIQDQLEGQHRQLTHVVKALNSYEVAYIQSREGIDRKLGEVLRKAEVAFESLSRRNEEIGEAIDDSLGRPLRETLTEHLGAMGVTLDERLGQVEATLEAKLSSLGEGLRKLDAPLNAAAQKFTDTFSNFNEYTDEWRTKLQREFAQQNETSQKQLQRLDGLSEQLPTLLQQLSTSSNTFTAGGEQLSRDVGALSKNVEALSRGVEALGAQVAARPGGGGGDGLADLLAKQTRLLQELTNRIERTATARAVGRPDAALFKPPKPSWWERVKRRMPFTGRR